MLKTIAAVLLGTVAISSGHAGPATVHTLRPARHVLRVERPAERQELPLFLAEPAPPFAEPQPPQPSTTRGPCGQNGCRRPAGFRHK